MTTLAALGRRLDGLAARAAARPADPADAARAEGARASFREFVRQGQRTGRNPASVTVTSRRTAASDDRLLAAARAWRQ